ncbi:MAG: hypothetical protein K8F60_03310 [Melioribacteraceae bacterium]|nr:hypothetical protein [Melioribacteraceae bacterium]
MIELNHNTIALLDRALEKYETHFGESISASLILSPASILLIGDHTQNNDGILITAAIDSFAAAILEKRKDRNFALIIDGVSFTEQIQNFENADISPDPFERIIINLIRIIKTENLIPNGFNCCIETNIPHSVGHGKISAILVSILKGINKEFHISLTDEQIKKYAYKSEEIAIGKLANIGFIDASLNAKSGKIIANDLRLSPSKNYTVKNENIIAAICDTEIPISKFSTLCEERVTECEIGIKGLRLYIWGIKNLRDVEISFLNRHSYTVPKKVFGKCKFTIEEIQRAEESLKGLRKGEIDKLGNSMFESHVGLREEYQINSDETDLLVSTAKKIPGVYGSKIVSCSTIKTTVTLLDENSQADFEKIIKEEYLNKFGKEVTLYFYKLTDGAKRILKKELNEAQL